jgi:hypothetical protein
MILMHVGRHARRLSAQYARGAEHVRRSASERGGIDIPRTRHVAVEVVRGDRVVHNGRDCVQQIVERRRVRVLRKRPLKGVPGCLGVREAVRINPRCLGLARRAAPAWDEQGVDHHVIARERGGMMDAEKASAEAALDCDVV